MKRFAAAIIILILITTSNALAQDNGVICFGNDLKKEQKESIIKSIGIVDKPIEVVTTKEDESKYLSGILPESRESSKSVVCAYVRTVPEKSGISVNVSNITYVTSEMITECLITAGIKDTVIRIEAPYSVSGDTSLAAVFKAYEKLTRGVLTESSKIAAGEELVIMEDLGQKIGMQKSLQFINEIKKEIINELPPNKSDIAKMVSSCEKEFNINLRDDDKDKIISLMDKINGLGIKPDFMAEQQKNISSYVDDLSKTTVKQGIIGTILYNILYFLKKVSLIFFRG